MIKRFRWPKPGNKSPSIESAFINVVCALAGLPEPLGKTEIDTISVVLHKRAEIIRRQRPPTVSYDREGFWEFQDELRKIAI